MSFEELERLWNDFEDVPIDKDECIQSELLCLQYEKLPLSANGA